MGKRKTARCSGARAACCRKTGESLNKTYDARMA